MENRLSDSRLANLSAQTIFDGFNDYQAQFQDITRRAKVRFEQRDWHGMQADAVERLELHNKQVQQVGSEISQLLGDRVGKKLVWTSAKAVYSGLIADHKNWELAETFFNSVTRRVFPSDFGVDPQVEFVHTDFDTPPEPASQSIYRVYQADSLPKLVATILTDYQFAVPYQDLHRDTDLVANQIQTHMQMLGASPLIDQAHLIKAVFYRGKLAYLVGCLKSGSYTLPLVITLLSTTQGIVVDAVLLTEDEASVVFSFARSYFHVDIERPYDLICFLTDMMPRKPVAELYTGLGHNKHSKTEFYRDFLHHLSIAEDKFEVAQGERGMVMIAFTLPSYDVIFKIIKDHFDQPKKITRQVVMEKYHLVYQHDRAGRMIDAHRFERLKLSRHHFSDDLLAELQQVAAQSVLVEKDYVLIKYGYVERRVVPLNIYVNQVDLASAQAAVIDYGNTIKDLVSSNIFPGDLLLKNFGVTRHDRVVFYDYDEICLLTDCNFRVMPRSSNYEDEIFAEPWFSFDDNDIFPEQFHHFLGLRGDLRDVFMAHHADLFEVDFWRQTQDRIRAGEIIHIFPYHQDKRLQQ